MKSLIIVVVTFLGLFLQTRAQDDSWVTDSCPAAYHWAPASADYRDPALPDTDLIYSPTATCRVHLQEALLSAHMVLSYYSYVNSEFNDPSPIDSILFAQDQMDIMVGNGMWESPEARFQMSHIKSEAEGMTSAITGGAHRFPSYTSNMYRALFPGFYSNFWFNGWRRVNQGLINDCRNPELNTTMLRKLDKCVQLLVKDCTVTALCWDLMTDLDANGLQLSTQLIYFKYAEASKCYPVFDDCPERFGRGKIPANEWLINYNCANMYKINLEIAEAGYPVEKLPIFYANIATCGSLGFVDFVERRDWFSVVLGRQLSYGCYGEIKTADQTPRTSKCLQMFDACHDLVTNNAMKALVVYIRWFADKNGCPRRFRCSDGVYRYDDGFYDDDGMYVGGQ